MTDGAAVVKTNRTWGCLVLAVAVAFTFASRSANTSVKPVTSARFKAVAFDYFVLFNPDSIVGDVEQMWPGKGREFTNIWRTRQFEYAWLRPRAPE